MFVCLFVKFWRRFSFSILSYSFENQILQLISSGVPPLPELAKIASRLTDILIPPGRPHPTDVDEIRRLVRSKMPRCTVSFNTPHGLLSHCLPSPLSSMQGTRLRYAAVASVREICWRDTYAITITSSISSILHSKKKTYGCKGSNC